MLTAHRLTRSRRHRRATARSTHENRRIRERYLAFFESKGHVRKASDVLVPRWIRCALHAGRHEPVQDHFLWQVKLEFTRATTCQKCCGPAISTMWAARLITHVFRDAGQFQFPATISSASDPLGRNCLLPSISKTCGDKPCGPHCRYRRSQALLARCGPRELQLHLAQKVILELVHAGRREEHRRIQRGTARRSLCGRALSIQRKPNNVREFRRFHGRARGSAPVPSATG